MKKDKEKEKARITNMLVNMNPLAPESSIGKLFDKYVRYDRFVILRIVRIEKVMLSLY